MNPESNYPAQFDLVLAPPEAVVIHCCDYRFQAAIHDFIRRTLSIHSYDLFVVPGGAHSASMPDVLPKHHTTGKQSLKFLVDAHQLKRIILIDHAECAFFKHRLVFYFPEPSFNEKQIANSRRARAVLREWFPGLIVEAYFADIRDDPGVVTFNRID